MSGWDLEQWGSIVFGLFFITIGGLNLLDPPEDRAHGMQSRHGTEGTDRPRPVRWPWIVLLVLGTFYILDSSNGPGDKPVMLIVLGGFGIVMVLWTLLVDPLLDARRRRRHEAKLAALATDSETYMEELRALHANPPIPRTPQSLRQWSYLAMMALFSGTFLALGIAIERAGA